MGCNQVTTEEPKADCVFTEKQYLLYMMDDIQKKEELHLILDRIMFDDLKKEISTSCWHYEDKAALARLLEDYIRYSIQETYDNQKKNVWYTLDSFGHQFGQEVAAIKQSAEKKNEEILKTLDFYKNLDKFQLELSASNEAERKKIHDTIMEINKLSENCKEVYFLLTLILVRGCRNLEKLKIPMSVINQKLEEVIKFINNDFIDTPETEVEAHTLLIYHQIREQEYLKYPSKIYDTKFQYRKVKLESDNKEQQFENEIMKLVEDAKKQYHFYELFLKKPVKKYKGNDFKINFKLKLKEDVESLERIKEKILLKQDVAKIQEDFQLQYDSIDELLAQEKKKKQANINRILKQQKQISLNISDILRAKCTFYSLQKINDATKYIIDRIERRQRGNVDIELLQIENRLKEITNDLVLKIRIRNTVTEFQMSLALKNTKNFSFEVYHKVYEISRSKMLSSISMLFRFHQKMTINYIKFLNKVMKHENTNASLEQRVLFEKLKSEDDVQNIIEKHMQNMGDEIPLKKDIVSILTADGVIDKEKVGKVREGTQIRTVDYLEKVGKVGLYPDYAKKAKKLKQANVAQASSSPKKGEQNSTKKQTKKPKKE